MAGAATDGDVLGARGSSANGPMAGIVCLTVYARTRVNNVPWPISCERNVHLCRRAARI